MVKHHRFAQSAHPYQVSSTDFETLFIISFFPVNSYASIQIILISNFVKQLNLNGYLFSKFHKKYF